MKKIVLGSLLVASSLFAGNVLAVVNGTKITKTQVNDLLKAQHITYDKLPPQVQQKVLNQVITQGLLIQKAENSGIEKTKEYKEALNKVKSKVAVDVFMQNKFKSFKITDKQARNFYNKNKEIMFKHPAEVKARHILVKTKAEADKIISELKNVPQSKLETKFIELAKKYSTGPTGVKGGELGWFTKGRMIPAFSKVAFAMHKGEISLTPVHSRFGYHVIYVQDKRAGGYVAFDKVKDKIKEQLKFRKLQNYIKSVRDSASIQYK